MTKRQKDKKTKRHLDEIRNNTGMSPNERRASHTNPSTDPAIRAAFFLLKVKAKEIEGLQCFFLGGLKSTKSQKREDADI